MVVSKEVAPEDKITIKVESGINGHNDTVFYTMKKTSKLQILMNAYCERTGFDIQSIRFWYDDSAVRRMDTPSSLGLVDGSEIYIFQGQG
ncbi:small ubiquitin-related modifier 3-like [Aphis gossypii]|uniref:small ubiquitin-related modifier 3-like n=1 Tax=Aphis gossypii TaxID=80765 RepID=UPI002158B97B|nr:small ubiquitin-related modifier 3-like [Aphis gossypii]